MCLLKFIKHSNFIYSAVKLMSALNVYNVWHNQSCCRVHDYLSCCKCWSVANVKYYDWLVMSHSLICIEVVKYRGILHTFMTCWHPDFVDQMLFQSHSTTSVA